MPRAHANAARRGCLHAILALLLVPVVVAAIFGAPWLVASVLPVGDLTRVLLSLGGSFALLVAFAVLALRYAAKQTAKLDAAFAAVGAEAHGLVPNLREYRGTREGRALSALYARGGGVELSIASNARARVAITSSSLTRSARELVGLPTLPPHSDPALAHLVVLARDVSYAGALLADPIGRAAVLALLHDPSGTEHRWVHVGPTSVRLTRKWMDVERAREDVPGHVDALAQLAALGERLPIAGPPETETALERAGRAMPRLAPKIVLGVMAAGLGLVTLVAGAAAIALMLDPPRRPEGPVVLEGVIAASQPTVESPVGSPVVWAEVTMTPWLRNPPTRPTGPVPRVERRLGSERVLLDLPTGPRALRVTSSQPFRRVWPERKVARRGSDWERSAPPGQAAPDMTQGYAVEVVALRPGDPVFAVLDEDGELRELWRASEEDFAQIERVFHLAIGVIGALALLALLGAVACVVLLLRRR